MNIPNLPLDAIVDQSGKLTDPWKVFFEQLISELQKNVSNEGYILPEQPTSNIALLTDLKGAIIYDSDNDLAKVNLNGTFRTILTA